MPQDIVIDTSAILVLINSNQLEKLCPKHIRKIFLTETVFSELKPPRLPRFEDRFEIVSVEDEDREFIEKLYKRHLGKEVATSYRKGKFKKHLGEFEAIAVAKRKKFLLVVADTAAKIRAKIERIPVIDLAEVPEYFNLNEYEVREYFRAIGKHGYRIPRLFEP